jgi:adhesin transport system outer membrane protein
MSNIPCARRMLAATVISAVAASGLSGPAVARDTLVGVVQEALATHPELGAIRFNRRAINHELTAARGLQLPTLDVKVDQGRHRDYNRSSIGVVTGGDTHWHTEVHGVATQRLFDGFESRHEIARQRNRVESARWRVMDTANAIALRAVQAYLEVLRVSAVLSAAQANVASHRALLSRVGGRVDGGRAPSSDLSEARSRTAQAEALLVEAEGRLRDADAMFRAVVGRGPAALQPAGLPAVGPPPSVDAAVAEAVAFAPSALATTHDHIAAEAALGSAYGRLMPRVNLEVSSTHGWNGVSGGDRDIDVRAMVVVRWNLFNGGIDKARIWEAKSRSLEAAEISANARRIIERETRASWNAIQTASGRVPLLRRQAEQIKATRATYNSQFDAGSRRLLDLLNVQSELFVADAALRTEEFVRLYNTYRLLAAMGHLVPALGLEAPPEAVLPHAPSVTDGWRDGWATSGNDLDYHRRDRGTGHGAAPAK